MEHAYPRRSPLRIALLNLNAQTRKIYHSEINNLAQRYHLGEVAGVGPDFPLNVNPPPPNRRWLLGYGWKPDRSAMRPITPR